MIYPLTWLDFWGSLHPGLDDLVWWHDVAAGQSYIPLTDGQKSVVGLWHEQQGKLAHLRSFDARGQVTTWEMETETPRCQESATSGSPCELDLADSLTPSLTRFGFGWHSAWRSATTGLVQMRQRWYSPKLGQFLSHDPLEYLDSHNLYAFGARDPVNGWDPMGLGTQGFANEFLDGVGRGANILTPREVKPPDFLFELLVSEMRGFGGACPPPRPCSGGVLLHLFASYPSPPPREPHDSRPARRDQTLDRTATRHPGPPALARRDQRQ